MKTSWPLPSNLGALPRKRRGSGRAVFLAAPVGRRDPHTRRPELVRKKVYDPVLRLIHATNALAVLMLLGSGITAWLLDAGALRAQLHALHMLPGYALVLGLVARGVWGIVGPEHARLARLWNPADWIAAARDRTLVVPPYTWGHHPPATLAYLLAYLLLACLALSGLALLAMDYGQGPLASRMGFALDGAPAMDLLHLGCAFAVLAFVLLHLGALVVHQHRHRLPQAQAMLNGYQYLPNRHE